MEDFNINEFAKMFDAALASDNPAVKKALRNFMLIAAITHAESNDETTRGPFSDLMAEIKALRARVDLIEQYSRYNSNKTTTTSTPATPYYDPSRYVGINPTWVYNPNTSISSVYGATTASLTNSALAELELNDLINIMEKEWKQT